MAISDTFIDPFRALFARHVVDSVHEKAGTAFRFIGDAVLTIFRAGAGQEQDASQAALASD